MIKLGLSIVKKNKYFFSIFSLLLLIISFLISDLIILIFFPLFSAFSTVYSATQRLAIYFSFFTVQTNYLVAFYLFFTLIIERVDKKFKVNFNLLLAVTVYITTTMFVFWLGFFIFFKEIHLHSYYSLTYAWVNVVVFHLVVPIFMISYFVLISGKNLVSFKTYYKLYLWLILIYPLFYFLTIMIRGELRYKEGFESSTCFPYFFLNYHENGFLYFFLFLFIIFLFIICLQNLYIYLNNFIFKKNCKKNNLIQNSNHKKISKKKSFLSKK